MQKLLWSSIAAEYRIGAASSLMLRLALHAHQLAREAHAMVGRDGVCVPNRDGNPVVHPGVRLQLREFRAFMQAMKILGVEPYP